MKWNKADTIAIIIFSLSTIGVVVANLRSLIDTKEKYGNLLTVLLILIGLMLTLFWFVITRYNNKNDGLNSENENLQQQLTRENDPDCEKDLLCRAKLKQLPEKYKVKGKDPNSNTIIYNNIKPLEYSTYSEDITQGDNVKTIFTVFAFDPVGFFRIVADEMKEKYTEGKYNNYNFEEKNQLLEFIKSNENDFWSYINSNYPHFQKFEELSTKNEITVTRILIKTGRFWLNRNLEFLEYFIKLGLTYEQIDSQQKPNIPCYIIDAQTHLKGGDYLLSDHVTYTENEDALLATYDIEAQTLLITPEKVSSTSDKLISHFNRNNRNPKIYHEIGLFIKENNPKYKSYLYREYSKISELPTIQKIIGKQVGIIVEKKPKTMLSIGIGYGDELNSMLSKLKATHGFEFQRVCGIDINNEVGANLEDTFKVEKSTANLVEYNTDTKFECVQCSFVIHDIKDEDKCRAFEKLSELIQDNGTLLISEMLINNKIDNDPIKDLKRKNQIDKLYIGVINEVNTFINSKSNKEKKEYELLKNKLLEIKEDARQVRRDYFIDENKIKEYLNTEFTDINVTKDGYFAVISARKKG
jgi:ubiquinone/menaquinone biosynthesis C-methylase UbiE